MKRPAERDLGQKGVGWLHILGHMNWGKSSGEIKISGFSEVSFWSDPHIQDSGK